MDLLAPCRSCLQCLPFFHVSPRPLSPRLTAAAPSSSPHSVDPLQSSDNLPCPSAAPTVQEQDLCLPSKVKEEPQAAKCNENEAAENGLDVYSTATESETLPVSEIVIAPPVSSPSSSASPPEDSEYNRSPIPSDLPLQVPFINDITFPASGFMPLPSPITPAPFGAGYPQGQFPPHYQIYQDHNLVHAHSHHRHENSQHSYEHSLHDDESSQHEADANSHHGHNDSLHGDINSHDGHLPPHSQGHATPDAELPCPYPPSDDTQGIHELTDGSHRHSHPHSHDSQTVDDTQKSVTGHASLDDDDHCDQIDDIFPTPSLEATQSTPDLDPEVKVGDETSALPHTNGAPALLETYHSEPVALAGDQHDDDNEAHDILGQSGSHSAVHRHRRRDHFRDQFKGLKQQIKQGGHHLKEEGNKHMQTIIENMNKQAQQIEQSGSFFMVPRANNN